MSRQPLPTRADGHRDFETTRRGFLRRTAAFSLSYAGLDCAARTGLAQGISNRYAGLKSKRYVSPPQVETRVDDDDVFTEGPAVDRDGIVYFTNIPVSKILKWDPRTKKLAVFRTDSHQTNGLLFDRYGNLLACVSTRRAIFT